MIGIKERFCFGADMGGGGGSESTHVECDDLGNGRHYTFAEVDKQGAVVKGGDGRFQRLSIEDLGKSGVQIFRGVNDNPILEPGQTLNVAVGQHAVRIMGTAENGVFFNGARPTRANEATLYPKDPIKI